ncbi:MAG: patatin-like phospholipase family protein [Syntrophaceae bacterium]|nr:patatin-like phospholipase family protein [Syntrophaceae bacterium]
MWGDKKKEEKKEDKKETTEDNQDIEKEEEEKKKKKKFTVGVAMGTGGFRMSFHAGFIDGLTKMGIEVDQFVGTSTGALSAFLGSVGVPGYEWLDDVPPVWHFNMIKPGFIEDFIKNEVKKRLSLNRQSDEPRKKQIYESMNSKMRLIAADFPGLDAKVFDSYKSMSDVAMKIIAATSIPYQTKFPVKVNADYYIDGFFATLFPYELPMRFLETDIKISLRVVPPYLKLNIPNIRIMEFVPKVYKYNLLQGVLPLAWMIEDMYRDGYRQALHSRIERMLGMKWVEKRSDETRRREDEDEDVDVDVGMKRRERRDRREEDYDRGDGRYADERRERSTRRKIKLGLIDEGDEDGGGVFNFLKRKGRSFLDEEDEMDEL